MKLKILRKSNAGVMTKITDPATTLMNNINGRLGLPKLDTNIKKNKKVGRNDPCPCGSGLKYKRCCLGKEDQEWQRWFDQDIAIGQANLKEYQARVLR